MSGETLSLVLDGLIILLLAGTIYYAARLSLHIRAFRDSRRDLEKLIGDLGGSIAKAESAIEGLRISARQSGRDLQALINEAQALRDELQIMSQSGDSLAGRLEKLADKSVVRHAPPAKPAPAARKAPPRETVKPPLVLKDEADPLSMFAIRDPEFDEREDEMDESGLMRGDREDEVMDEDDLGSEAERDLYMALRRKKKTEAGGVS